LTSHAYLPTQCVRALGPRIAQTGGPAGVDINPSASVAGCVAGSRGVIVRHHASINQYDFVEEVIA
jgi:hypothetical protein